MLPRHFWTPEEGERPPNAKPSLGWRPDIINPFSGPPGNPLRVSFGRSRREGAEGEGDVFMLGITRANPEAVPLWARPHVGKVGFPCVAWDPRNDGTLLSVDHFKVGIMWLRPRHFQDLRAMQQEFPLEKHDYRFAREQAVNGPKGYLGTRFAPERDSAYDLYLRGVDSRYASVWTQLEELIDAIQQGKEISL